MNFLSAESWSRNHNYRFYLSRTPPPTRKRATKATLILICRKYYPIKTSARKFFERFGKLFTKSFPSRLPLKGNPTCGFPLCRPDSGQADSPFGRFLTIKEFRCLRTPTAISRAAHDKLLKKFDQNFPHNKVIDRNDYPIKISARKFLGVWGLFSKSPQIASPRFSPRSHKKKPTVRSVFLY